MKKKIKIAVIGVGYLGNFHSEKYSKIPDVELVAVIDSNLERAKSIAERYGAQYGVDFREILPKVDAVSIVVPTYAHYEVAKVCLESQVDVLVEKPMTQRVWEAQALMTLSEEKKRILQVGHLERFNPALLKATQFLTRPLFIECHRLNSFVERGTDVDVILDLMIHDLDIILNFVKSEVCQIDAMGTPVLSKNIDIASCRIQFQNGCVANLTASRISPNPMRKMRIFQPDGYVSIDFGKAHVNVFRKVIDTHSQIPEIQGEEFPLEKKDALEEEIKSFIASIQNRSQPVVSTRGALEALRLAHQIVDKIKKTMKKFSSYIDQELSI